MEKSNLHIEIVRSSTSGLSSMSEESAKSIFGVLARHFTQVGLSVINNLNDLRSLAAARPDIVFLGMEFIPSDPLLGFSDPKKIWLSEFLDSHHITYTGSAKKAHELERNKPLAKQRVMDYDLKSSPFQVVSDPSQLTKTELLLGYPLFVKPANRGGGLGIDSLSVVRDFNQLSSKVSSIITNLHSDALIEEYLPGREFSVAILKDEFTNNYLALPIELVAPPDNNGARLLSSQVKARNAESVLEIVDEDIKKSVNTLALGAFHALGGQDYGRIDIRLDATGRPNFLEANLIPSLISGYGSFPKACVLNIDLDYEPMILRIVSLAIKRKNITIPQIIEGRTPEPLIMTLTANIPDVDTVTEIIALADPIS